MVQKPVVDHLSCLAAPRQFDQADDIASPCRVLGISPTVALVLDIAERVERLLVARGRDVQTTPAGELHPGGYEVELDPILVGVSHPEDVPLVTLQAGEGQSLEGVHHLGLLALGRRILPREGHDARAVGPLVRTCVDLGFDERRVAAQHFRQRVTDDHHRPARCVT